MMIFDIGILYRTGTAVSAVRVSSCPQSQSLSSDYDSCFCVIGEMEPGWIVYLLKPTTNVTNDRFVFTVTDPGE